MFTMYHQKNTKRNISHQRYAFAVITFMVAVVVFFPHIATTNGFDAALVSQAQKQEELVEVDDGVPRRQFPVSTDRAPRRVLTVVATAYSSDTWQTDGDPFVPADGSDYKEEFEDKGFVRAIASNDYPLGTKVRFPEVYGNQVFVVRDRMNRRYTGKYRVDVYHIEGNEHNEVDQKKSREQAKDFGVQWVKMEIL